MSVTNYFPKADRVTVLHMDQLLDEALEETFAASDPVAVTEWLNAPRLEAGYKPRAARIDRPAAAIIAPAKRS